MICYCDCCLRILGHSAARRLVGLRMVEVIGRSAEACRGEEVVCYWSERHCIVSKVAQRGDEEPALLQAGLSVSHHSFIHYLHTHKLDMACLNHRTT